MHTPRRQQGRRRPSGGRSDRPDPRRRDPGDPGKPVYQRASGPGPEPCRSTGGWERNGHPVLIGTEVTVPARQGARPERPPQGGRGRGPCRHWLRDHPVRRRDRRRGSHRRPRRRDSLILTIPRSTGDPQWIRPSTSPRRDDLVAVRGRDDRRPARPQDGRQQGSHRHDELRVRDRDRRQAGTRRVADRARRGPLDRRPSNPASTAYGRCSATARP